MNLDFLEKIVAWAQRPEVSLLLRATVKVLVILASFFPGPAYAIMQMVEKAFDGIDKQREQGIEVSLEQKRSYTENIVDVALAEYHGSGSLLPEWWIRQITAAFVGVLGGMRYGEDFTRMQAAELKGYMSSSEDVRNAAKTHAGFKLFGV